MIVDDKLCDEAIVQIGRTPQGKLLYLKLQKVLMSVPARDAKSGALREHSARRTFAAELMALLADGLAEPIGDGTDTAGRQLASGERPIVFKLPDRGATVKPGRTKRRVGNFRGTADGKPGPTGSTG